MATPIKQSFGFFRCLGFRLTAVICFLLPVSALALEKCPDILNRILDRNGVSRQSPYTFHGNFLESTFVENYHVLPRADRVDLLNVSMALDLVWEKYIGKPATVKVLLVDHISIDNKTLPINGLYLPESQEIIISMVGAHQRMGGLSIDKALTFLSAHELVHRIQHLRKGYADDSAQLALKNKIEYANLSDEKEANSVAADAFKAMYPYLSGWFQFQTDGPRFEIPEKSSFNLFQ